MTSTTPAGLTAIKEDLIAKGVKYCIGAYVDIHGVPKGKVVPVNHFESFAQGSELYTGYALDGLGQRPNDDELSSVPDLSRGVQLPWQPEVMWYLRISPSTASPMKSAPGWPLVVCWSRRDRWASGSTWALSVKCTS